MMKYLIIVVLILSACQTKYQSQQKPAISPMPMPVSNNAVALVKGKNGIELYSFNGLSAGKTWQDIHNFTYRYKNHKWQKIHSAGNSPAVLASTAVTIGKNIYLIGGYTVDADKNEKSIAEIYRLDTVSQQWQVETQMPIPVDDTVALVYANRYIYLVSGWHDVDNVSAVQVYDSVEKKWFVATDFPAPAVFGHAGGIVGNQLLICDGVKVLKIADKKDFQASAVCVFGVINPHNPAIINWQIIAHHTNTAYYRMAAVGDSGHNRVIFVGGSDNPYNFDGIGYNGQPSQASDLVFAFDFTTQKWNQFELQLSENMDHRGLLFDGEWFYILGGMTSAQKVTNQVLQFKLIN